MKKLFLVFLFAIISFVASAQVLSFRATGYSQKVYTSYGWTDWSRWQTTNILMTINVDTAVVKIYSAKPQTYKMIYYDGAYIDRDGDEVMEFRFVDQDGDYGTMRLMQRVNGRDEVYIQFANVIWCYSVVRL